MIAGLYERVRGLPTWPRLALAAVLGVCSTAAMPPWDQPWLLWLSFPLLLWLVEGCRSWRGAAVTGWAFGVGHFALGLHWIANAFYVDAETHGAFAIPAVAALCAICALYIAAVTAATRFIPHDPEALPYDRLVPAAMRAGGFALAWSLAEWVRGWLFTGFPWNPLAVVWTPWPAMIQGTSVVGTLGLGFLTVGAASFMSLLGPRLRSRSIVLAGLAPTLLLAAIGGLGALRIGTARVEMVPDVTLRLVQPNISQADKWRPGLRERHFMDHVALSTSGSPRHVTHVIWGEAAVAYALDRDEARRTMAIGLIRAAAPDVKALITGAPRAEGDGDMERIYNSLMVIGADGAVRALYDKTHLVPFGEYLPLRGLIPFRKLTEGTLDFSAGHGRTTLDVDGLPPFSPLICYEAIFSGAVTGPPRNGQPPRWLLNLTNDSWFGDSSGPRQHLAQAQLRAVEEGLPMVRVANTGISAVIDPYGRVLGTIPLNQRGTLDSPLPREVSGGTWFGFTGQLTPLALLLAIGSSLWRVLRRRPGAGRESV